MSHFRIGPWSVEPSLNRLDRGVTSVRLEPKLMDVLCVLHERKGEVVSKQELIDAVWPDAWVTESVVTRAIAGLRKALEDDCRKPQFIETISKRGYRLTSASPIDGERRALLQQLAESLLTGFSRNELRDLIYLSEEGEIVPLRHRDLRRRGDLTHRD